MKGGTKVPLFFVHTNTQQEFRTTKFFPSELRSLTAFNNTNTQQDFTRTKFFPGPYQSPTAVGVKYMVGRSWTSKPFCRGRGGKLCG
jgi:hypothetical protein